MALRRLGPKFLPLTVPIYQLKGTSNNRLFDLNRTLVDELTKIRPLFFVFHRLGAIRFWPLPTPSVVFKPRFQTSNALRQLQTLDLFVPGHVVDEI